MELHVVDHDGGLTSVVDDPGVADYFMQLATIEIHVDIELRIIARRANSDAGIRAHGSPRSDVDPAAAREKHTCRVAGAAEHSAVQIDRLPAVALIVYSGHSLHHAIRVNHSHMDAARAHAGHTQLN